MHFTEAEISDRHNLDDDFEKTTDEIAEVFNEIQFPVTPAGLVQAKLFLKHLKKTLKECQ